MTSSESGITASQYVHAFGALEGKITLKQREILEAHYRSPAHTSTATQLAEAVGYRSNRPVNSQYGNLAKALCAELDVTADPWLNILAGVDRAVAGDRALVLWSAAVEALRRLGWFPSHRELAGSDEGTDVARASALEGSARERLALDHTRDRQLRERKIEQALRGSSGRLPCEVPGCGFDFFEVYGKRGQRFIHVHHLRPLAERDGAELTALDHLALVCANCHAMIHRDGGCAELDSLIVASPAAPRGRR